jgi:intein-encoded DNA endonuclease-like protein
MTTSKIKILEKDIIKYYEEKLSAVKISEKLKIDKKTVYRVLNNNNIKTRTLSEAAYKYTCDNNFFEVINTEEKAYWLGVLYADGNITNHTVSCKRIFLTSTDKEWVEDFLKAIKSTNTPKLEKHNKFKDSIIWKAAITSPKMHSNLNNLGCTPVKSMTIRIPNIKDELVHHFIRGYFDGDGTVGAYKNLKNSDWKILKSGFCSGSQEFIIDLLKILPVKNKTIKQVKECYITQHSLQDTLNLFSYMYKDYTTCLERKRQVFINYLDTYKPRKRFNDYNRPSLVDEGIV